MVKLTGFLSKVQMSMAIRDIQRYQAAYIQANNAPGGILVRYKMGYFCIGKGAYAKVVRPLQFRNMTAELERRVREK